jgi:FkbM family methyltransferase
MHIKQSLKNIIRKLAITLKLDLTKNLEYDRLTEKIFRLELKPESNAIDIGCHKGEILDLFFKYAPKGNHYAFEPLPSFFKALLVKYKNKNVSLFNYALSNKAGETEFTFVKNNPAYSGFIERDYDNKEVDIEKIKVEMAVLDKIIPQNVQIDLIKIDVEGAELQVLQGAEQTIKRCKPVIVFEHGMGASDYYETTPEEVYAFLHDMCGLKLYTLKNFSSGKKQLTEEEFKDKFYKRKEYYFVASK